MTASKGRWGIPSLRWISALVVTGVSLAAAALSAAARSAAAAGDPEPVSIYNPQAIMLTAALVGVMTVAVACAVLLMRARARAADIVDRTRAEAADLRVQIDRSEALLNAGDQITLAWGRPDEPPAMMGALGSGAAPIARAQFMAFGSWLTHESAARLEHAIDDLRTSGTGFEFELATHADGCIDAVGRASGGQPFVRFRDLSDERTRHAELRQRFDGLSETVAGLRSLLDALDMPVWVKDRSGRLNWVNAAYVRAVEAAGQEDAIRQGAELLDGNGRKAITRAHADRAVVAERLPVIVAGSRRVYDIVDVALADGTAGLATDVSALESVQSELRRTVDFHARTLDQLATAVAIFGPDKKLQFYNAAYRALWGLDPKFLDGHPEDGVVLDEIRAARKLPEQADFRGWKRDVLAAYHAVEAREFWWHLPDGQTLRVIANPHPQGGVTYVYENVTERLELEQRNNALIRVQGETLDHLSEGVAVFGSDGKLRLWNPSFAALWKLEKQTLTAVPHIADVISFCGQMHEAPETWRRLQQAVAGLVDSRMRLSGRMDRRDGSILEYATVPLPDGATLVTFVNITDTVNVERALTEKAEALMEADRTKTDFVGLVSYELRSPLTNIIGFAHLLDDPRFGDLNEKQRDYTQHIMTSSQALMAIVDDILDLATIDAGIMQLQLSTVDIVGTVHAAIEGVKDRIEAGRLTLATDLPAGIGSFEADEKRIRQLLFNLIANAVRFSRDGGTVHVGAARDGCEIVFTVADDGAGIPEEQIRSVFDRFFARRQGPHRSGAGLGLSVVKSFVELHGGKIAIDSAEGRGTTVICRFPASQTRGLDQPDSAGAERHG
ncbi:MAG: PAS-domain containing protein [Ancalomicrobiaceae bacterium]|nr:PAS-domain containing protein [Ancalomicrobiaceae bacterium]